MEDYDIIIKLLIFKVFFQLLKNKLLADQSHKSGLKKKISRRVPCCVVTSENFMHKLPAQQSFENMLLHRNAPVCSQCDELSLTKTHHLFSLGLNLLYHLFSDPFLASTDLRSPPKEPTTKKKRKRITCLFF